MADDTGTNLADDGLLDDTCDDGDSRAGSQQAPNLSATLKRNFCQSPVTKRVKYVYCEHCLRDVSEKTYRNHCNLHFPDDRSMMQENADPGMFLQCVVFLDVLVTHHLSVLSRFIASYKVIWGKFTKLPHVTLPMYINRSY